MLTLRPYQEEAISALDMFLRTSDANPCVVLPTGSGKSLVMADAVRRWKADYPPFRAVVLAHRKELVEPNAKEFAGLFGGGVGQLGALGAEVEERPDGFTVRGGTLKGGTARANGDHRLAMSMALCGLRAPVSVEGAEILNESFPGFVPTLRALGA